MAAAIPMRRAACTAAARAIVVAGAAGVLAHGGARRGCAGDAKCNARRVTAVAYRPKTTALRWSDDSPAASLTM